MLRVLLAIDMRLLQTALAQVLSNKDGMTVVATQNADVTAELIATVKPDVAVVELDNRHAVPLATLQCLAEHAPDCRSLALIGTAAPVALRRALETKALGIVSKECDINRLVDAVLQVAAGERFIEPRLAIAAICAPQNPLTAREFDVLRLAADGLSSAEIAGALYLTRGTVRNYLSAIVNKLGAKGRLDAVRIAVDANWI